MLAAFRGTVRVGGRRAVDYAGRGWVVARSRLGRSGGERRGTAVGIGTVAGRSVEKFADLSLG